MKLRRPFVYLLLSLLLVFSQQMGITHALSHWSQWSNSVAGGDSAGQLQLAAPGEEGAAASGASKSLALDQGCGQCLAFAQIGAALHSHFYSFPVVNGAALAVDAAPSVSPCRRTVCAFRSRAPPVLS